MPSFNRVWLGGKSIAESKAVGPAACPFGEEGVRGQVGTRCLAVFGPGMITWNSHFWFHLLIALC